MRVTPDTTDGALALRLKDGSASQRGFQSVFAGSTAEFGVLECNAGDPASTSTAAGSGNSFPTQCYNYGSAGS